MKMRPDMVITSAKQALKESMDLETKWSSESLLTQRILIYIAELLERGKVKKRKERKPTKWNIFCGKAMREGKTVRQAAEEYKQLKGG